ncbi:MAG: hypothetical protein ACYC2H_00035 [Thermoplasmatota archaeon]
MLVCATFLLFAGGGQAQIAEAVTDDAIDGIALLTDNAAEASASIGGEASWLFVLQTPPPPVYCSDKLTYCWVHAGSYYYCYHDPGVECPY